MVVAADDDVYVAVDVADFGVVDADDGEGGDRDNGGDGVDVAILRTLNTEGTEHKSMMGIVSMKAMVTTTKKVPIKT